MIVSPLEAADRSGQLRLAQKLRRRSASLALHVAGKDTDEIAKQLGVSARTVRRDLRETWEAREVVDEVLRDDPFDSVDLHLRLTEILDADIADIIDEATGKYKPIHKWPRVWRQMLSGLDVKELFERSKDGGGDSWDQTGQVLKIKYVDQLRALELLGRLKSVDALVKTGSDAKEVAGAVMSEIDKRIAAGRQRAATTRVVATLGPATDVVDSERAAIHNSLEHCRKMAGEDQ